MQTIFVYLEWSKIVEFLSLQTREAYEPQVQERLLQDRRRLQLQKQPRVLHQRDGPKDPARGPLIAAKVNDEQEHESGTHFITTEIGKKRSNTFFGSPISRNMVGGRL
jgi:hypothetical protein